MKKIKQTYRPRYNRLLLPGALLLILVAAAGCTREEEERGCKPNPGEQEVEAAFAITVEAQQTPLTRSITLRANGTIDLDMPEVEATEADPATETRSVQEMAGAQEDRIQTLWIGQYNTATGGLTKAWYMSSLINIPAQPVYVRLTANAPGIDSRIWLVANAGDLGSGTVVNSEANLKTQRATWTATNSGLPANGLLPMVGVTDPVHVPATNEGLPALSVTLTRLVAKISLTYSMGDELVFRPTHATLQNAPSQAQLELPTARLTAGITYTTYTEPLSASGGTIHYYLPENMAGDGDPPVTEENQKIGIGRQHPTSVTLHGSAVQGGVTYGDVTFQFFPGSDVNNYDIRRNTHYRMHIVLTGIDLSDHRITVGQVPPVVVDPEWLGAALRSEKTVQIPIRPGVRWSLPLPRWLSGHAAEIDNAASSTIEYAGPVPLIFRATEANPEDTERNVNMTLTADGNTQPVTITQAGSELDVRQPTIELEPTANETGAAAFTATYGLPLRATFSAAWLDWEEAPPTEGDGSTPLALKVKTTTANPDEVQRQVVIPLKAGRSATDDTYTNLAKEITVTQKPSSLVVSPSLIETPPGGKAYTAADAATFIATAGLDWNVTPDSWITITGSAPGQSTTGVEQPIDLTTAYNPAPVGRTGTINVKAGNITRPISVTQAPSEIDVSPSELTIFLLENAKGEAQVRATPNLPWTVTRIEGDTDQIEPRIPGSSGSGALEFFSKSFNSDIADRWSTFSIAAGTHPPQRVKVTQSGFFFETSDRNVPVLYHGAPYGPWFQASAGLRFTATYDFRGAAPWFRETSAGLTGETFGRQNRNSLAFTVSTNPGTTARTGYIDLVVSDPVTSAQLRTARFTVTQPGTYFTVSKQKVQIGRLADDEEFINISISRGLRWWVNYLDGAGFIAFDPHEGYADVRVTLRAGSTNDHRAERTGRYQFFSNNHGPIVVEVTQDGANDVWINPELHSAFFREANRNGGQPFDYDNAVNNSRDGGVGILDNTNELLRTPYRIEVQRSNAMITTYDVASLQYCRHFGRGWRVPTLLELYGIYKTVKTPGNEYALGAAFDNLRHWSSSIRPSDSPTLVLRSGINFNTGEMGVYDTQGSSLIQVRCVRTIR